jgi:hypothetical protein
MDRPAIVEAAANPVTSELEHLIELGHDVNQADNLGVLFVVHEIDITLTFLFDRLGYTALHIAAGFGNDAAVRCLLNCSADINAISKAGVFFW